MRTIKKLSMIFLAALILMMLPLSSYSYEENMTFDNLAALGVSFESIGANDINAPAKRSELAYIASKLIDGKTYENCLTAFSDVTDATDFSGYINNAYNAGIFSGTADGIFSPSENVSVDNVYKVMTVIAGYETLANAFGNYPEGYRKAASQLGIFGKIETDSNGNVTLKGLFEAAETVLENEYEEFSVAISESGVNLEKTGVKKSVFSDKHNISIYKGMITDINDNPYSANVTLKGNVFESNKVKFLINEKKVFLSETDINLFMYENADVTLWVDNDENKIVQLALANNVEIRFTTIAAVNGDESPLNKYGSPYIDNIKLYDDKKSYKTSDNFKVRYNMNETTAAVYLTDKFAKVIITDNAVSYIESWALSEGGIISEITGSYIKFISGDNDNKKIEKLDTLNRITVYKNSDGSDIKELRTDTYFDYYLDGEKLVIVASEKKISDILRSVSTDEIEIGNGIFNKAADLYVKNSNGSYVKNGNLDYLFNKKITAYFDASGYCRYISSYSDSDASDKQFLGIIEGSVSDSFNENAALKVLSFEGTRESKELSLSKNCRFSCGKTLNEILAIKDTTYAENVFEFFLNDKNEIIEIKNPQMYYGFPTATYSGKDIPYVDTARISVDSKYMIFTNEPILKLLKKDGKLYTETTTWSSVTGAASDDLVKLRFFGDGGMNSNFRLILLSGDTATLSVKNRESSLKKGIVTKKTIIYDDEESKIQITVNSSGRESNFIISAADAKRITSENMYIKYYTMVNSDYDIMLKNDEKPEMLQSILDNPPSGWTKKTVIKSDSRRMFFDDGSTEFYSSAMFIKKVAENEFEFVSYSDVGSGDTVCYEKNTYGISTVIVE